MMQHAATWAGRNGATHLALAVTRANAGANALYSSLGMEVVGQYHYRMAAKDADA
jgi:ribosomal protein S18 acetylase RimI-like enzyme